MEHAMTIIENAQNHWDKDSVAEHGFEPFPGDAVLYRYNDDPDNCYRVIQFSDIILPMGTPQLVKGVIMEYVVTEADFPATYTIEKQIQSSDYTPDSVNQFFNPDHYPIIYAVERTDTDRFEIANSS